MKINRNFKDGDTVVVIDTELTGPGSRNWLKAAVPDVYVGKQVKITEYGSELYVMILSDRDVYFSAPRNCFVSVSDYNYLIEKYQKLLGSGIFHEFHPDLTGDWEKDAAKFAKFYENLNSNDKEDNELAYCPEEMVTDVNWGRVEKMVSDMGDVDLISDDEYLTRKTPRGESADGAADRDTPAGPEVERLRRFPSGAVRSDDSGRPKPTLISPWAIEELSRHLTVNANKFDKRNYWKGIPVLDCLDSLQRHYIDAMKKIHSGDSQGEIIKELRAIAFNAIAALHTQALINNGLYKEVYSETTVINAGQI